jgi:hypothetical protein
MAIVLALVPSALSATATRTPLARLEPCAETPVRLSLLGNQVATLLQLLRRTVQVLLIIETSSHVQFITTAG